MQQTKFLANKIKRQIKTNGQTFNFKRYKVDKYHQVSDEIESEFSIEGIFHTTNSYVRNKGKDAATFIKKQQPMILCMFEDGNNVQINDIVSISGNDYVVNNKNNINDFDVAFDLSLEMKI